VRDGAVAHKKETGHERAASLQDKDQRHALGPKLGKRTNGAVPSNDMQRVYVSPRHRVKPPKKGLQSHQLDKPDVSILKGNFFLGRLREKQKKGHSFAASKLEQIRQKDP